MCYEQEIEETDRQLLTASFTCPSFLLFPCDGQVEAVVTAREETIVPAAIMREGLCLKRRPDVCQTVVHISLASSYWWTTGQLTDGYRRSKVTVQELRNIL